MSGGFIPGPWRFEMEGDWPMILSAVQHEEGGSIPVVNLFHGGYDFPEWSFHATAHLIAAAPDLYEALQFARAEIEVLNKGDSPSIRIIDAVLSKARGNQ